MKVLVVIKSSPSQRFLLELHTKQLVEEVARLLSRRKHSLAIATALSKGRFEKEISERELSDTKADLIITEQNASWDLTDCQ